MPDIQIVGPKDKIKDGYTLVDTTSKGHEVWTTMLSPFFLGPVSLYGDKVAKRMENAWQFAKVYEDMLDEEGNPSDAYWKWAEAGWADSRPQRYPKGKGAKPAYALWDGEHLGYIDARKTIYFELYKEAVGRTPSFSILKKLAESGPIALFDFDGYDHDQRNMSLAQVINNPARPMGHAFVLKAMLLYGKDVEADDVVEQQPLLL